VLQFQATRLLIEFPYSWNQRTGLSPSLAGLSIPLVNSTYLGHPDYNSEKSLIFRSLESKDAL
jgi:hypothetical protein